jgi:hypothetical protein
LRRIVKDKEVELSSLPVDDVGLEYGKADLLHKHAVTEVLGAKAFLLSCEQGYTVVSGSNLNKATEMFSALIVQLEREYGKAFTRALTLTILSRLTPEEIKGLIRARFTSEGG